MGIFTLIVPESGALEQMAVATTVFAAVIADTLVYLVMNTLTSTPVQIMLFRYNTRGPARYNWYQIFDNTL